MIETKDIHWAAGFLDGEGSFGSYYQGCRNTNIFQLTAVQNDRQLLDRLVNLFGGSVHKVRTYHQWVLTGPNARGLAMTLFSLMSDKRKAQIKKMLSLSWRTRRQVMLGRKRDPLTGKMLKAA